MSINMSEVISTTVAYLSENIYAEQLKYEISNDYSDFNLLLELITDLGFQVDFHLMTSVVEVQLLYDGYRIKKVEESNIQMRTLLKLTTHIINYINDNFGDTTTSAVSLHVALIERLVYTLTLHSNVDFLKTCQDDSIVNGMNAIEWRDILDNNPWLIAAICIQHIPSVYLMELISGENNFNKLIGGESNETQYIN